MLCVKNEYCTETGVASKSPVSLTLGEEFFRVPLSDCRDPITKEVGKCCRDPDYVDPWPLGSSGQYFPDEINSVFPSGIPNNNNVFSRVNP